MALFRVAKESEIPDGRGLRVQPGDPVVRRLLPRRAERTREMGARKVGVEPAGDVKEPEIVRVAVGPV